MLSRADNSFSFAIVAALDDPAGKHGADAEDFAYFDRIDLLAFVTKDQTGGTDSQVRQLGKTINQRLSQAFGKIFAVRFGAPVLKRQDRDRVNRDLGVTRM